MSHTTIREIQASDTWALRQQVMWPDRPISYVMLKDDPVGTHYGLYQDKLLISVISVFVRNGEAQFRKFATLASEQGKGYGTMLLSHLFEQLYGQQVPYLVYCTGWHGDYGSDLHQRRKSVCGYGKGVRLKVKGTKALVGLVSSYSKPTTLKVLTQTKKGRQFPIDLYSPPNLIA